MSSPWFREDLAKNVATVEFQKLWLCEPPSVTKFHADCYAAAVVYEIETDNFDHRTLTGPLARNGDRMPGSHNERRESQKFAQSCFASLVARVNARNPEAPRAADYIRCHLNGVRLRPARTNRGSYIDCHAR